MRVIEIQAKGGFPSLVLESKKKFAETYGLEAEYWKYFEPSDRPDVLSFLKTNLTDLANHYHACYQDKRKAEFQRGAPLVSEVFEIVPLGHRITGHQLSGGRSVVGRQIVRRSRRGIREDRLWISA